MSITLLSEEFSRRSLEIGMDIWRSFRFIESVGSFVSLPHPVDNEHDEKDGAEETHYCTSYNS